MISTTKEFIYDYFALAGVDLNKWNEEFYWPVSRQETTDIVIDLVTRIIEILDTENEEFYQDCIKCSYQFVHTIPAFINHYVCVNRLAESGTHIHYSKIMRLVPWFLGHGECPFDMDEFIKPLACRSLFRRFCRTVKLNYMRGALPRFFSRNGYFAIAAPAVYDRRILRGSAQWITFLVMDDIHFEYRNMRIDSGDRKVAERLANKLADWVRCYTRDRFSVGISSQFMESLVDFIASSFLCIAGAYRSLLKSSFVKQIKQLYTTTAGRIDVRLISMAVRRCGGRVAGFPHGYYICHYKSPRPIFHELTTVDEFVAYNENSRALIERNIGINSSLLRNRVIISSDNDSGLYDKWRCKPKVQNSGKIQTVMLVELSLLPEWAGYHVAATMVNYNFYYNICLSLTKNGYKVLFKRRPKGIKWGKINIFSGIPNVEIIYEPFETPGILDRADAIICTYAMSSTLYYAMCSSKVVIYVDAGWDLWFDDVYELVRKRCRILHCHYNERNQQCYDEQELLNILKDPKTEANSEFVDKYLYPS